MGIPGGANLLLAAGGVSTYEIDQSLRFDGSNGNLSRTFSASNRKTWTWSAWVKRSKLGANQAMFSAGAISGTYHYQHIQFNTDDKLQFVYYPNTGSTTLLTSARFRDPSAWYHIVAVWDTTQATASNRAVLYVNGERQTALDTANYSQQNTDGYINSTAYNSGVHYLGRLVPNESQYFGGYMAEVHFVDGSALDPTDFGEEDDNGVWRPISFTGSHGTTGFYLDFSNTSAIGEDQANSNDWTANNITTSGTGTDVFSDTPTNNWCTWNAALGVGESAETANRRVCSEGNLTVSLSPWDANRMPATFGMTTGKWYWEIVETSTAQTYDKLGITDHQYGGRLGWSFTPSSLKIYAYENGQGKYSFVSGSTSRSSYGGNSFSQNDVLGVAFDADAGELTFYKNGTSQGTAFTGLTSSTGVWYPMVGQDTGSYTSTWVGNFGQRAFAYTPPSGYSALNTSNLPTPDIAKGSDYFNTVIYTGNNSSSHAITGVGFQPDFVWIKARNQAYDHRAIDVLRGVTKVLRPNTVDEEYTSTDLFKSFDSDGFTLGDDNSANYSSGTYVAWNWLAGGSGSSNTSGSITSTVSANPTAGFSIVTYTGAGSNSTIGHGLGVAPKMVWIKKRNSSGDWVVYTEILGPSYVIYLNYTYDKGGSGVVFGSSQTAPTSTVFSVGNHTSSGASGDTYVAYCFAEVEGYSKIGSYTGNGSSDGPFVYCGFRPAWILIKRSDASTSWIVLDSVRSTYNPANKWLNPDTSSAEATTSAEFLDILSNGFKLKYSGANNTSAGSYIFAAFAENPFGGDGVSPATAR